MILSCPSCGTQYVVKDGAIPPQGRQVRCASCKHSWHQDPEVASSPAVDTAPQPAEEPESIVEASLIDPRSGPEVEERAFEDAAVAEQGAPASLDPGEPAALAQFEEMLMPRREAGPNTATAAAAPTGASDPEWQAPAENDDFSPFAAADYGEPRRRSPLLRLAIIALLVAALAAAFWFLAPPEWKARVGLDTAGSSPLAFVITHRERQQLQSGNQLLTISGRIINPTSSEQSVPPIQAQLKTRQGKVIYSWTIAPPTRSLPPGASASFNSAEVNVPPGGDDVTITTASNG